MLLFGSLLSRLADVETADHAVIHVGLLSGAQTPVDLFQKAVIEELPEHQASPGIQHLLGCGAVGPLAHVAALHSRLVGDCLHPCGNRVDKVGLETRPKFIGEWIFMSSALMPA